MSEKNFTSHEGHMEFGHKEQAKEDRKEHRAPAAQSPRILIIGPQGSGKGTQAARIAELFGIPAISTGDVFRANVKNGTELGHKVKAVIDSGDLVDDILTGELVRDRLNEGDTGSGFLLDGYPRNLVQAGDLDAFLATRDESVTAVIELDVPREISVTRLITRASEQGRADDTEEVITKRLEIYEAETTPVVTLYRGQGVVDLIDGVGSLDAVTERIVAALVARGITPGI